MYLSFLKGAKRVRKKRPLRRKARTFSPKSWLEYCCFAWGHSRGPGKSRPKNIWIVGDESMNKFTTTYFFVFNFQEVVDRFGRFPQRNKVLGRENTPEEEEWLNNLPDKFKWWSIHRVLLPNCPLILVIHADQLEISMFDFFGSTNPHVNIQYLRSKLWITFLCSFVFSPQGKDCVMNLELSFEDVNGNLRAGELNFETLGQDRGSI